MMAFMSLTGWAAITVTAPGGATGLMYDGTAKALIATAATATGEAASDEVIIYYRVTSAAVTDMPTFNRTSDKWVTDIANITATDAGAYKVWYVAYDVDAETSTAASESNIEVSIAALALTTGDALSTGVVFTAPGDLNYNGLEQKSGLTVNLTYNGEAVSTTGWTVAYQYSATAEGTFTDATSVTRAGFYKQVITAPTSNCNFSGSATSAAFEVKKADLLAKVIDKTWYYDGTVPAVTIEYDGFVNGETATTADNFVAPTAAATKSIVGTEDVTPTGGSATDYNIVNVKGTVTINPAGLKVTVKDGTAGFGTDASKVTEVSGAPYFTAGAVTTFISVEKQTGQDPDDDASWTAVTTGSDILALFVTAETTDETPVNYIAGLTLSREEGTSVGEYEVTATGATAASNYAISEYIPGTFEITAGAATITVENQAKTYGDPEPFADNEWPYTISGVDDASKALIAEKISVTRVAGEDAGSYDIVLTVADNDKFTDFTVNAEYKGKLIITKAPLKITASEQVLYTDDTEENLDQTAATIATLVGDETLDVTLSFGTTNITTEGSEQSEVSVDADGKLDAPTTYDHGIVVTVDAGQEEITKNYNITLVNGKLTVLNNTADLYLDDTDANLENKIKEVAAGETELDRTRDVTFSSRTLKAGQWNTLVLPFATSVPEISGLLGYAVVDVLAPSTNPEVISLKLAFAEIPANTPFLVQPAEDINLAGVTFDDKEIVYSATPEANDGAGHKFIGTYVGHDVTSADKSEYFYSPSQKKFVNAKSKTTIDPMRAYLKDTNAAGAGARIITIEEPDGSVTAIDAVEAQNGENNGAIYNLQGVRVNKAGKGVFIQNGKKYIK